MNKTKGKRRKKIQKLSSKGICNYPSEVLYFKMINKTSYVKIIHYRSNVSNIFLLGNLLQNVLDINYRPFDCERVISTEKSDVR